MAQSGLLRFTTLASYVLIVRSNLSGADWSTAKIWVSMIRNSTSVDFLGEAANTLLKKLMRLSLSHISGCSLSVFSFFAVSASVGAVARVLLFSFLLLPMLNRMDSLAEHFASMR